MIKSHVYVTTTIFFKLSNQMKIIDAPLYNDSKEYLNNGLNST